MFRRNSDFPLPQQRLDEAGDAPAGDWNVFDAGADDVALGDGNDVRDAVAGVDDDAGQRPLADGAFGPAGGQRKNGLK